MKICHIGCGNLAFSAYRPSYIRCAAEDPDLQLAAACDIDLARAADFCRQTGYCQAYADYRTMIRQERPDGVIVTTPYRHTAAIAGELIDLGLPVLLEKPPGSNADETRDLIRRAAARAVPNQVAFNRRFMPLVQALRSRLPDTPTGRELLCLSLSRVNRLEPDFHSTAIHGIDLVSYILRSPYASVEFLYQPAREGIADAVNILMNCVMQSGALAQLAFPVDAGVVHERLQYSSPGVSYTLHLPVWSCPDTPGRLTGYRGGQLICDLSGSDLAADPADLQFEATNGFYQEISSFLNHLRRGQPPAADLASAEQPVAIAGCLAGRAKAYQCQAE